MNYVQMYKWKWVFFLQWILITTSDWWTAVINQMADWRFFSMETRLGGLYAAMGLRKKTPGLHVGSCDYLRKQKKNLILFCSVCHVLILLPLQIYISGSKYQLLCECKFENKRNLVKILVAVNVFCISFLPRKTPYDSKH